MSGGGKTDADKLEGVWEFYGHMDRRWDADPCAPVDYYDPDASLTFPEALRLCCYAADYERGVRPPERRAGRHAGHRAPALLGPAGCGAPGGPAGGRPARTPGGDRHAMSDDRKKPPPLPMPSLIPVGEKVRRLKAAGEWPPAPPARTLPRPAQPRRRTSCGTLLFAASMGMLDPPYLEREDGEADKKEDG